MWVFVIFVSAPTARFNYLPLISIKSPPPPLLSLIFKHTHATKKNLNPCGGAVAEFLDVIGKKFFSLLFTVTSTNGFYPPPHPSSKSGLKLVCSVNIVYGNLKSENSLDYAQKPLRNCMFMNSASGGKISPAWWGWKLHAYDAHPLSLYLPSRTKLWCTLQLRGQVNNPPISTLPLYVLCGGDRSNIRRKKFSFFLFSVFGHQNHGSGSGSGSGSALT